MEGTGRTIRATMHTHTINWFAPLLEYLFPYVLLIGRDARRIQLYSAPPISERDASYTALPGMHACAGCCAILVQPARITGNKLGAISMAAPNVLVDASALLARRPLRLIVLAYYVYTYITYHPDADAVGALSQG